MKTGNFFSELKRRNVYKVAIAYGVIAWLLIQAGSILFPTFEAPTWVMKVFVAIIAAGFPIAVIFAWAFELTPEGVKRTEAADAARQPSRGAAWIYVVAIGAALSVGLFLLGRYMAPIKPGSLVELPGKSLAVLPFANLSGNPENAYFAAGIQSWGMMNEKPSFFAELKRRNVYKVAVAYAIVGWLVVQIATQVFPFLEIPNWVVRLVIAVVAIGFPIALVIAWAFELTPEGIKRTESADAAGGHSRGGAWIVVVVIAAALSLGLFLLGRYTAGRATSRDSASPARIRGGDRDYPEIDRGVAVAE